MEFKNFEVLHDDEGRRLDRIVRRIFESESIIPDANFFALFRKRLVRLNDRSAKPESKPVFGDKISIASFLLENHPSLYPGRDLKKSELPALCVKTVFRNKYVWIIDKPKGINVQPSFAGDAALSEYVLDDYGKSCSEKSLSFVPGPLHRLDCDTTGLVCFSQNLEGARWVSENIRTHAIKKTYLAVVEGNLCPLGKTLELESSVGGKEALTRVRTLCVGQYGKVPVSLAEFRILTGRKHQIRIHASENGHPLLGDEKYGGMHLENGFLLHAAILRFPLDNPCGIPACVMAEIPGKFNEFIKKFLKNFDIDLYFKDSVLN